MVTKTTYNGTTTSITNHEVLTWFEVMKICQVSTAYGSGFEFPNVSRFSKIHKLIRKKITNVIMCRRSLQLMSPAVAACTKPAVIAAERIMLQLFASHAAGTVSHTSAETVINASMRAPSNLQSRIRTQISHTADLSRDLLVCILPQNRKEINDEVNGLFPGLRTN